MYGAALYGGAEFGANEPIETFIEIWTAVSFMLNSRKRVDMELTSRAAVEMTLEDR